MVQDAVMLKNNMYRRSGFLKRKKTDSETASIRADDVDDAGRPPTPEFSAEIELRQTVDF